MCQTGQVVVNLGGDRWVTWANGSTLTGHQVGVAISNSSGGTIPGTPLTVITTGRIPWAAFNIGAGPYGTIVAGKTPGRGTLATAVIGTCDAAGEMTIWPSYVGIENIAGSTGLTVSQFNTSVSAGLNSNVSTNGASSVRFTGASGPYSIGGLALPGGANPAPGQAIDFENTTAYPMTIVHLDGSSTAKYQISVSSQSNYTYMAPYSRGRVVYDGVLDLWKFTAVAGQPIVTHNVLDFGAVGNANFYNAGAWYVDSGHTTLATDDSAAIAAAFTAAAATTALGMQAHVKLSGNHYLATPQVSGYGGLSQYAFFEVTSNTVIDGNGATLRLGPGLNALAGPNPGGWAMFAASGSISNVIIRDVFFDGNGQNGAPTSQGNSFISFTGNASNNILVEGCQFTNQSGWNAVFIAAVNNGDLGQNVKIANCGFVNIGNATTLTDHVALYLQAEGVTITGCNFFNDPAISATPRNFGQGIQIQGIACAISGCTFTNMANAILLGSYWTLDSSDFTLSGNSFIAVTNPVQFAMSVGLTLSDIAIVGNTFNVSNNPLGGQEAAILLTNVNGGTGAGVNRVTVSGNVFTYTHDSRYSDFGPAAIVLGGIVTGLSVTGNHFESWPQGAMVFTPGTGSNPNTPAGTIATSDLKMQDLRISGNTIKDCGVTRGTAVLLDCDTTYALSQRVAIYGNTITSTGSALTTGITAVLAGDTVDVYGNVFQNVTTPQAISSSNGLTNLSQGPILKSPTGAFAATVGYDTTATASTLVQRDSSGNISGVAITGTGLGTFVGVKVSDGSAHLATIAYDNVALKLGDAGKSVTWIGQPVLGNSQWLQGAETVGGAVDMMGLDSNNALRLDPLGATVTAVGAIASVTGAGAGDMIVANALRFSPTGSADAYAGLELDGSGNVYLSPGGLPIRVGLGSTTVSGGTPAVLGSGVGVSGNPTTAAQNGWIKMFDSGGNPFWIPVWR